jgi:hypothetical protein
MCPLGDKFQIITAHDGDTLRIDPHIPGYRALCQSLHHRSPSMQAAQSNRSSSFTLCSSSG